MKIAIASSENHLKAAIDLHFGRCLWFCIYDTITRKIEFLENPVSHHLEKAGCDAAEYLIQVNVELVVAGRFGSRVSEAFRNHNIQMVIPAKQITVQQIINQIK